MRRWLGLAVFALIVWSLSATTALADPYDWPVYPLPSDLKQFPRGPGYYFSLPKLLSLWFVFLAWVGIADWINRDAQQYRLDHGIWNPIIVGVFFLGLVLSWVLPLYILNLGILLVAMIGPALAYVFVRNGRVAIHQKVLTPAHFRYMFASTVNKFGGKMAVEKASESERGPAINLTAGGGGSEAINMGNLVTAKQSPGYRFIKELIHDALQRRADAIRLDFTAAAAAVQYQIDGVWHSVGNQERAQGDALLACMKVLSNLKPAERRARQAGFFVAAPEPKVKYTCRLTTQGTAQGEVALLQLEGKKTSFKTLEDAGMRQKTQEDLMNLFDQKSGIILFCSPPQGGLSVLYDSFLEMTDRYLRNFVSVEDLQKRDRDIENVHVTTFDTKAGEAIMDILPKVARTYPDVMVVREPQTQEVFDFLLTQPEDNRFVLFGIRAKEAVEAPVRVLMLKTNHSLLATTLMGVVNVRLVRKLCEQCREAYAPPPELLKQMGIPAGKLEALYRPPTIVEGRKQEICQRCNGIGYYGRTGIYELLSITDDMRKVLAAWPKLQPPKVLQMLRDAQRAAKQRTLQEEGLLLVARGTTSVQELIRCLKG